MENLYARFKAKNSDATSIAKANLFFTENNNIGYMSKEELGNYLNSIQELDFLRLQRAFEYSFKKFPINNFLVKRLDTADSEDVVWCKFKLPNSVQSIRLVFQEGLMRFLQDYQEGKFRNGFQLDELLQEAGIDF